MNIKLPEERRKHRGPRLPPIRSLQESEGRIEAGEELQSVCNDEVAPGIEAEALSGRRHRRFTAEEKRQILEEMLRPGANISRLARQHGTSPGVLFRWRKRAREGSLIPIHDCGATVSISQVRAREEQVRQLERLLGKKTAECETLREALEMGRAKDLVSGSP